MVRWLNNHITVGLPVDLYEKIKKHPEVRWSAIALAAMIAYLEKMEKL